MLWRFAPSQRKASHVAGYVTGTSVFVDGGMTDYPAFAHGG